MANIKETMSAFIDEEANEIETHRLLRSIAKEKNDNESHDLETRDQASLITSFITFMSIRTSMLQQSYSQRISLAEHEALFQRISSAIGKEPTKHASSVGVSLRKPVIGFALAASLLVVVSFVTLNMENTESVKVVGEDNVNPIESDNGVESELRDLDAERQRHLRQYLNEHDRVMRTKRASQLVSNPK